MTEWTKLPRALPPSRVSWEVRLSQFSVARCSEDPEPRTCPTDVTDGRKGLQWGWGGVGGGEQWLECCDGDTVWHDQVPVAGSFESRHPGDRVQPAPAGKTLGKRG